MIFEKEENIQLLAQILPRMKSIIVYRSSPAQKAEIVRFIRNNPSFGKPITASIGDGANDVNMILAAHLGVGISGLEGQQASRAADYSVC